MKIQKTIQTEQLIEIEIDTPCWFKVVNHDDINLYQVNSEKDITEVQLCQRYTTINRMGYNFYHRPERIFDGEVITEQQFKDALQECLSRITTDAGSYSPVMPVPTLSIAV